MIALSQRPRKNIHAHPRWPWWGARALGDLVGAAPEESRVEWVEQGSEVNGRILDDPVKLAFWPSDIAVQTSRNCVPNPSHKCLLPVAFPLPRAKLDRRAEKCIAPTQERRTRSAVPP